MKIVGLLIATLALLSLSIVDWSIGVFGLAIGCYFFFEGLKREIIRSLKPEGESPREKLAKKFADIEAGG